MTLKDLEMDIRLRVAIESLYKRNRNVVRASNCSSAEFEQVSGIRRMLSQPTSVYRSPELST